MGYSIETSRMLLKGCFETSRMLWCWLQLYGDRSIHARCVYHIYRRLSNGTGCPYAQAPRKERRFPPQAWMPGSLAPVSMLREFDTMSIKLSFSRTDVSRGHHKEHLLLHRLASANEGTDKSSIYIIAFAF